MADDTYLTVARLSEGLYKEKMSKFISFAIPVSTLDEVKETIARYQKEYYDARHVCWAYMLGHARTEFRANDNGEPSGTAGKPILGQINSFGLTDVLIVVVRYFGGIKLGTSGLIEAYRAAAADAIRENEIVERLVEDDIRILFEYPFMNDVMRIVKEEGPTVLSQYFELDCEMTLRQRRSLMSRLRERLSKVESLRIFVIPSEAGRPTRNPLLSYSQRWRLYSCLPRDSSLYYCSVQNDSYVIPSEAGRLTRNPQLLL